ncbi:hypothetical protein BYT27DRAFT_7114803, partial [Phlegmacium glaucopus]
RRELKEAEGTMTDIHNKEQAIALLRTEEYLVLGEPVNSLDLSHAMLQFSHREKLAKTTTDIIRAFTFLITDISTHHTADDLVSTVKVQLTEQMDIYNSQVETMRDC